LRLYNDRNGPGLNATKLFVDAQIEVESEEDLGRFEE